MITLKKYISTLPKARKGIIREILIPELDISRRTYYWKLSREKFSKLEREKIKQIIDKINKEQGNETRIYDEQ